MGNCCGKGKSSAVERNAFKGEASSSLFSIRTVYQPCSVARFSLLTDLFSISQGQRLGTVNETYVGSRPLKNPEPVLAEASYDPNLTDDKREKQRAERVAAVEARLKKQGTLPQKKKKASKDTPLVGPNSKPLMTWTAG
jgi:hypothetical protein